MWKTVKLGDVIEKTETVNPTSKFPNESFEYIDVSSVSKERLAIEETQTLLGKDAPSRARRRVHKDDVIFATVRPTLKRVAVVPTELDGQICSTGYIVLKSKKDVLLPRYLFHWMSSQFVMDYVESVQTGASYPAVTDKQVKEIDVQLPPLAEQQRIVAKLDAAFAEIDRALGIISRQESEGKLFAAALSYQISAPNFPKANIQTLCEIGDGNHSSNYPKKAEMLDIGVPFIRAGNIQNGTVIDDDLRFISEEKHAQLKKGHLREGDVLITNRGEIGKTAIVPKQFNGANLNSQIAWLRPHDNLLSEFLFFALNTTNAKNTFVLQQSGAALQQLTIKQLKAFEIPLPSLEQQQRIVECLRDVSAHTNKLGGNLFRKQKHLQTTKSALLAQELQPPQSEAA